HRLPVLRAIPNEDFTTGGNILRGFNEAALSFDNVLAVICDALDPAVALCVIRIAPQSLHGGQSIDYTLAVDVENIPVLAIVVFHVLPHRAPALVFHDAGALGNENFCE